MVASARVCPWFSGALAQITGLNPMVARRVLKQGLKQAKRARRFRSPGFDISTSFTRINNMKSISLACAAGAVLLVSSTAFAQTNPPSSATGLQAGDNTQNVPTHMKKSGTKHHKSKMSSTSGSGDAPSTGTATPSGPGAAVSASGSGQ
jgi:hypothetical protein